MTRLTRRQRAVLDVLRANPGPLTPRELAVAVRRSRSGVVQTVTSLIDRGLVYRIAEPETGDVLYGLTGR